MIVPRTSKSLVVPLIALMSLVFAAVPVTALENLMDSGDPFQGVGLQTLCDGDCSQSASVEARRAGAPFEADFELGLKVLTNGLDLSIETDGNIFIYGPLSASDSIHLTAIDSIFVEGNNALMGAEVITLNTGWTVPPFEGGELGIPPGPICGCITLGHELDLSVFEDAGGVVLNALVGLDALEPPHGPGVKVSRGGDIYIDVSMVEFLRFEVTAGKSLALVGTAVIPVPEPGAALLLGLGLSGLATRRTRLSA